MINDAPQSPPTVDAGLFSDGQIVIATFLGAPIGGALLLASNYRKLGSKVHARVSVLWGVVTTAAIMLVSFFLPDNFPNLVLPIAYCVAMRQLALYLQGHAVARHFAAGGRKGSWGVAIAAGLGCLALIVVLMFAVLMIFAVG